MAMLPALSGVAFADANPNHASCDGIGASARAAGSQDDAVSALKAIAAGAEGLTYGQFNRSFAQNQGGTIQTCYPL
jgi:hypothetical protein